MRVRLGKSLFGKDDGVLRAKHSGFTIIEFVIVIALMAVLAGVLSPMFYGSQEGAKRAKAQAEVDAIASAVRSYYSDKGNFDDGTGANIDIDHLVENGYLPQNKNDPWATPAEATKGYKYGLGVTWVAGTDGRPGAGTYVYAYSLGSDRAVGGTGNNEDIVNYVFKMGTTPPALVAPSAAD